MFVKLRITELSDPFPRNPDIVKVLEQLIAFGLLCRNSEREGDRNALLIRCAIMSVIKKFVPLPRGFEFNLIA